MRAEPASSIASSYTPDTTSEMGSVRTFKRRCKDLLAPALYHSGLLRTFRPLERSCQLVSGGNLRFRRFSGAKFAILCYHRVGTTGVPLFSKLEPAVFEQQIRYIAARYRVISLGQMCDEIRHGRRVNPSVAVTFDDGYRDLYTYAFPVLRKYQIPATIYLVGHCMETGQALWYDRIFAACDSYPASGLEVELDVPRRYELLSSEDRKRAAWEIVCYLRSVPNQHRVRWCAQFEKHFAPPEAALTNRMLNWNQVHEMQRSGISFGAHTMTHPSVRSLDAQGLEYELGHAKRALEAGLDAPAQDFAFPFGKPHDCSSEATDFLKRAGYRSACTTTEGVNTNGSDAFSLHRLQIGDGHSISQFAFGLSRAFLENVSPAPLTGTQLNCPSRPLVGGVQNEERPESSHA